MTYNTINDAQTIAGGGTGTVLANRYRIVRQLGHGGMGSVWLAEDMQLDNKPFAIKMLPTILVSNKRAYRQLKDEALVAMKLTHPNIVTLRAFEENGGNPFLVMDYIEGQTLDDYLAEKGKLGEDETVKLLKPIAAALDYAHGEGVVHRDVKPANVMIRKDGHPFILDFGIAREIQETLTRVTGKLSSGTLLYMSPEQLNGDVPKPAQDIYSFAAMAYECLKGEPPFVRGQIEYQIINAQPVPLQGGSGSCAASIMKGLAKKPTDRPQDCMGVLMTSKASSAMASSPTVKMERPLSGAKLAAEKQKEDNISQNKGDWKESYKAVPDEDRRYLPPEMRASLDGGRKAPAAGKVNVKQPRQNHPDALSDVMRKVAPKKPENADPVSTWQWCGVVFALLLACCGIAYKCQEKYGWLDKTVHGEESARRIMQEAERAMSRAKACDAKNVCPNEWSKAWSSWSIGGAEFARHEYDKAKRTFEASARLFWNCVERVQHVERQKRHAIDESVAEPLAKQNSGQRVGMTDANQRRERRDDGLDALLQDLNTVKGAEPSRLAENMLARNTSESRERERRAKWQQEGQQFTIYEPNGLNMTMKWCPPGTFMMGSPASEEGRGANETQHQVTITKGFWMGETEVTQGQWRKLMDDETIDERVRKSILHMEEVSGRRLSDSFYKESISAHTGESDDYIAIYHVNWYEAVEFCKRLTERERVAEFLPEGYEYRLPTETEWEYACRARTTTALPNGKEIKILDSRNAPNLNPIAWYGGNSNVDFQGKGWSTLKWEGMQVRGGDAYVHRVMQKQPNDWGLYDMIGNVNEWCRDLFSKEIGGKIYEVGIVRGGSWLDEARFCRSAARSRTVNSRLGCNNLGFRVTLAPSLQQHVQAQHNNADETVKQSGHKTKEASAPELTLRVIATIGGAEATGAVLNDGNSDFPLPVKWSLAKGKKYGPYHVSCQRNGIRYAGTFEQVAADWNGSKEVSVELRRVDNKVQEASLRHHYVPTEKREGAGGTAVGELAGALGKKQNVGNVEKKQDRRSWGEFVNFMPYINDRTVGKQYVNASVYCNGANIANKGKDDGGRWIFTIHKADIAATSLQGKSVRFEYGNKNAKRFISISDIGHDVEVELR